MVSISFDDGTAGHLRYAQPVLVAAELTATFYLISDALDYGKTNLDTDQARQLLATGQEIGNHTTTHPDLTKLKPTEVADELAKAQARLTERLGVTPTTCAYPYGARNAAVEAEAAKLFKGCRSTDGGANRPGFDPYDLANFFVTKKTTPADVRDALDQARVDQSWLIFTFHGIDPNSPGDSDITPSVFAADIQAIRDSGIPVKTVGQELIELGR